jgi:dodecin
MKAANHNRLNGDLPRERIALNQEASYMPNHTYKKIELVGSSTKSIGDAIESAIARAAKTTRNLDWFEVRQIRGHIEDGKVAHYQVSMKVGFRIED